MQLSGKKVIVTGADGFIGSHLTEALMNQGCDVRAFVYYNSFNSWGWLDSLPPQERALDVFAGDIRDPNGVAKAMEGCDVVFHLAALIAIPFSYHSPDSYVDTNIKGTSNVLQAARRFNTERVIVTSTSEVYGTAQYVPIDERHPFQGQSPYSATKIGADRLAESFFRSFETPVIIARPFNTYGPRQSGRAFGTKRVSYDGLSIYDLDPKRHGQFDFVLLYGVLYHLKFPLLDLYRAAMVCKADLIVETHVTTNDDLQQPMMLFYPGSELNSDPTNWWDPTPRCLDAMLEHLGYEVIGRATAVQDVAGFQPGRYTARGRRIRPTPDPWEM